MPTRTSQGNILQDRQGLPIINTSWASQSSWVIDTINGDDEKSGIDSVNSLKTWGELRRRMWAVGGHSTPGTTIQIIGDLDSNDPMVLDWGCHGNIDVHILGTPNVARSGSFTSSPTARNPATNTPNIVADSAVSSWASEISFDSGKLLVPSSGAASGYPAWMVKNLGSHQVRLSSFVRVDDFTEATPANGDTYDIEALNFVQDYYLVPTSGFFFVKYLDLGDEHSAQSQILPATATRGVQLTYCSIYNIDMSNSTIFLVNCCLKTPLRLFTGTVEAFAGCMGNKTNSPYHWADGEVETAGELYMDMGFLIQGIRENIINMGYARAVDAMIFDAPDNGIVVGGGGGSLRITSLSGSGNGQHGVYISPSGHVFVPNFTGCKITGNQADVYFAGTDYSWSTISAAGFLKHSTCDATISQM